MDYIKSRALAKKVTLNGKTIEQYPPPTLYTITEAAIEAKKSIQ